MTGNTWDIIKIQTKTNQLIMGNRTDQIWVRRRRQRKTKSDSCISVVSGLMYLTSFQLKRAHCKPDPSGSILSYGEEQHSDSILRTYKNDFRLAGVRDRCDFKVSHSSTFTFALTHHLAPVTHSSEKHTHTKTVMRRCRLAWSVAFEEDNCFYDRYVRDNVQLTGQYCKINPDRVICILCPRGRVHFAIIIT